MRERLAAALSRLHAPYAEIRLERRQQTFIDMRDDRLEQVTVTVDAGGFARAIAASNGHTGGWGTVTFSGDADVRDCLRAAIRLGAYADADSPVQLAPVDPVTAHVPADLAIDFRTISLADKQALLSDCTDAMQRHDPRIESTHAVYRDAFTSIHYANSEGAYIYQERPLIDLRLSAIARDGDSVQRGHRALALAGGYEALIDRHDLARSAAQMALDLLPARPVAGGRYSVVMDPVMSGLFVHEAIGHLSEADFISENPKAQDMMALGRRFGPGFLNVYDDGGLPGLRGSIAYDDEGVPAGRAWLVRDGVLVGRMHSRETAARMRETPTGNARATSYRYPPLVRMTNTAIAPAEGGALEDLIADVDLGVYACDWSAGETMLEDFTFVAKYGYMIRHGELAEPVSAVTLTGNVFETLRSIDRIGSDFRWDESSGDCGKGQEGLPVCDGGPHVRVREVLVGGQ